MGNCRIQNIVPPCGYKIEGIANIWLLDTADFEGFKFRDDGLYNTCYVSAILKPQEVNPVSIESPDTARYNSTLQNGIYTHVIETFISDISADLTASLHLATKRRFLTIFEAKNGRFFVFGYEAGAVINYTNQTAEGLGSLVNISANSIYPIFEAEKKAVFPWVLETGEWNMQGYWYKNGIWKY